MIAIQGHPTRGKEVIQILESLGGRNICDYLGTRSDQYYCLDPCSNITATSVRYNFKESEIFTLEKFEKEFPFKVGDKVITSYGNIGIIRSLTPDNDEIPYCIETEKGYIYRHQSELKLYKEMERSIKLTLEKAKEWYNKGGELREIALQAFTEMELNPLPKSWDEYCRRYEFCCFSTRYTNIPLKYDALLKLEQLRDCWRQGWIPKKHAPVYTIKFSVNELSVYYFNSRAFLSFPTEEMAKEFLKCFRDLIEQAGDLI